jgi:formate-nitrite transporter family protein
MENRSAGEQEREQSDGLHAPNLDASQRQEVEERASPSAGIVHEAIRKEGEDELRRPSEALAWSGLAAGLSMGFSLMTQGLLRASLPDAPWAIMLSRLGYTIGFLVVVLGRQQLFTENTLTPIIPLLARRDGETLGRVARLWIIVLLANIAGTFVFAWVIGATGLFEPRVKDLFAAISSESLAPAFGVMLLRAIFAGWLIALMVWLLPFAEAARFWVIIAITFVVGLGGFSHIVVGSVEAFYVVLTGLMPPLDYITRFFVPALLGNIIGGVSLVAVLGHAQVVAGGSSAQDD